MDVWKPTGIELEACLRSRIGPLSLWLRHLGDEMLMAVERVPEADAVDEAAPLAPVGEAAPETLTWARWVVGADVNVVQLVPAMPDRPVVVRPESPVRIPTGHEALLFVSIPLWVKVTVGESRALALCEEPTVVISGTWFGDPTSGELCYAVRTRARRTLRDSEVRPHRAICPVRIRNTAPEQLDVQRLCVHVEHLRTYDADTQPWTNEVDVTFEGEERPSRVDYAKGPPALGNVGDMLSDARTPLTKGLLRKTLVSFRSFAGM